LNPGAQFTAATDENAVFFSKSAADIGCSRSLTAHWSVHQSYLAKPVFGLLNPTIDGGVSIKKCKNWPWDSTYSKIHIYTWGDGYPWTELYYTKDWSRVWYYRRGPSIYGIKGLASVLADWAFSFDIPL